MCVFVGFCAENWWIEHCAKGIFMMHDSWVATTPWIFYELLHAKDAKRLNSILCKQFGQRETIHEAQYSRNLGTQQLYFLTDFEVVSSTLSQLSSFRCFWIKSLDSCSLNNYNALWDGLNKKNHLFSPFIF